MTALHPDDRDVFVARLLLERFGMLPTGMGRLLPEGERQQAQRLRTMLRKRVTPEPVYTDTEVEQARRRRLLKLYTDDATGPTRRVS